VQPAEHLRRRVAATHDRHGTRCLSKQAGHFLGVVGADGRYRGQRAQGLADARGCPVRRCLQAVLNATQEALDRLEMESMLELSVQPFQIRDRDRFRQTVEDLRRDGGRLLQGAASRDLDQPVEDPMHHRAEVGLLANHLLERLHRQTIHMEPAHVLPPSESLDLLLQLRLCDPVHGMCTRRRRSRYALKDVDDDIATCVDVVELGLDRPGATRG
jgi:hypothetical protein